MIANDESNLNDLLNNFSLDDNTSIINDKLNEKLKEYFVIGGMPEAVDIWIQTKDINEVNKVQQEILDSYYNDFSKHTTSLEASKISLVWDSITSQLGRENKKFLYQMIKNGARAREYESALNWLISANLFNKLVASKKVELPMNAYYDISAFKVYINDIGLLRRKAKLSSSIIKSNNFYGEFKGALTENFVFSHLLNHFDNTTCYYTFDNYEIDFLIQYKNEIIPIEVKSSTNINSISSFLTKWF